MGFGTVTVGGKFENHACRLRGPQVYKYPLALCLYNLATLKRLIPLDLRERGRFSETGTPSLAQGEAVLFPVLYHINSHIALSGETFFVPPRYSMHLLASPGHVVSFRASAPPHPDAQARQTLKTHHTHCDTRFQSTPRDDQFHPYS